MGKYRANMNHAGMRLGEVREMDDSDPTVAKRCASGALTRLDGPAPEVPKAPAAPKPVAAAVTPEPTVAEPEVVEDAPSEPETAEEKAPAPEPAPKAEKPLTAAQRRAQRRLAEEQAAEAEKALEAARAAAGVTGKVDKPEGDDGDIEPTFSADRASTSFDPGRGARG